MVRNFGSWLRDKRSFLALQQKELAEILGVSPKTISHYENGRCKPSNQKEMESVIRAMVKEKEYHNERKGKGIVQEFPLFDEESPEEEREKEIRYFTKEEYEEFHDIHQELFIFLLRGGLSREQRKNLFAILDKQFDLLKKYDFGGEQV